MYASMVIVAGIIAGGFSLRRDFPDFVFNFRHEMNQNGAWSKENGKQTVESALNELVLAYNTHKEEPKHTTDGMNVMLAQEYQMYSVICQETSLRKDSPFVRFLKEDMGTWLYTVAFINNNKACSEVARKAQISLTGEYDYRSQMEAIHDVKSKCAAKNS